MIAMLTDQNSSATKSSGLVLVVDDDKHTRKLHHAFLSSDYTVETAESGNDALQLLSEISPELIVLDVEMPGLDGYQTCRRIRETSAVPVIFVTAHSSLESQLEAFEAGANDIVIKPVARDIFLKKAALAIQMHANARRLQEEKNNLQTMAMNFLSSAGETGVLMNFLRNSIRSKSYPELADHVTESARALDIQCYGVIRTKNGPFYFRSEGGPTKLEQDILSQVSGMGRIFQFKTQLVVNYEQVSIIATNLPLDAPEKAGSFRDNLCTLAETTESLSDNVEMRQESMNRAEQLQVALMSAVATVEKMQSEHRLMLADTRVLLEELVDKTERTFSWLGTSTDQETSISKTLNESVHKIIDLLNTRGQFDSGFSTVINALRGSNSQSKIELF